MIPLFATTLLTFVTAKLLGSAARAADLVLDADTKLVQLENWRLAWFEADRARAPWRSTGARAGASSPGAAPAAQLVNRISA